MNGLAYPTICAHERCPLSELGQFIVLRLDLLVATLHCLSIVVLGCRRVRVYFHLLSRFTILGVVRALVESGEQEVEHDGVRSDKVREGDREVAVVLEQQLECVGHHHHELHLR